MSKERVKELLGQLREELRKTDVDEELDRMIGELDDEVQGVVDTDADVNDLVDRAKGLEADFASRHPAVERFMREVIDTLVRMGI
ncbi:MAG: DUF4404 family protein [Woeseiaceae bacterium]|nr:DUF4404 family protein [Woeseiaceae bacterium]